jgi:hypothetical protein
VVDESDDSSFVGGSSALIADSPFVHRRSWVGGGSSPFVEPLVFINGGHFVGVGFPLGGGSFPMTDPADIFGDDSLPFVDDSSLAGETYPLVYLLLHLLWLVMLCFLQTTSLVPAVRKPANISGHLAALIGSDAALRFYWDNCSSISIVLSLHLLCSPTLLTTPFRLGGVRVGILGIHVDIFLFFRLFCDMLLLCGCYAAL